MQPSEWRGEREDMVAVRLGRTCVRSLCLAEYLAGTRGSTQHTRDLRPTSARTALARAERPYKWVPGKTAKVRGRGRGPIMRTARRFCLAGRARRSRYTHYRLNS